MLSALLSCIAALGQSQLLYSISKPNSEETSYLYGTIHLGDSVLLSWDDTFLDAFYSCDVQVGEIDFINLEISPAEGGMMEMMSDISKYDSSTVPQDTIQKIREILLSQICRRCRTLSRFRFRMGRTHLITEEDLIMRTMLIILCANYTAENRRLATQLMRTIKITMEWLLIKCKIRTIANLTRSLSNKRP